MNDGASCRPPQSSPMKSAPGQAAAPPIGGTPLLGVGGMSRSTSLGAHMETVASSISRMPRSASANAMRDLVVSQGNSIANLGMGPRRRTASGGILPELRGMSEQNLRQSTTPAVASFNVAQVQIPSTTTYVAVLCVAISPLLFGYSLAFTSPAEATMKSGPEGMGLKVLSERSSSLFGSLINVGAAIGAGLGAYLSESFGRKRTLVALCIPYFLAYAGIFLFSSPFLLCSMRVLLGLAVGAGSAVTPQYISEIATTNTRGAFGAMNQLAVTVGILLATLVGIAFGFVVPGHENEPTQHYVQWRQMALVGVAMSLCLSCVALMPESPTWLASRGRRHEASVAVSRLRDGDSSLELAALFAFNGPDEGGPKTTALSVTGLLQRYWRSFEISIGLLVFQQLSGINAVVFYTEKICLEIGVDAKMGAILSMLLMAVMAMLAVALMDRAGRKTLLLGGLMSMAMSLFVLRRFFVSKELAALAGSSRGGFPPQAALGALFVYIAAFSISMGPIPWLIAGEVSPIEAIGAVSAVGTTLNWTFSFIVTLTFDSLLAALNPSGCFCLFGLICVAATVFVLVRVPETAGRGVAEVMEVLGMAQDAASGGGPGLRSQPGAVEMISQGGQDFTLEEKSSA